MTTPEPEPVHQEIQELLGAYALDAVDAETAAMVERHLDECVRCSIEVAQHHEVAGLLGNSGGASPSELWDGIARRLDGSAPPPWERLAERLGPEPGPARDDGEAEAAAGARGPTGSEVADTTDAAGVVSIGSGPRRGRTALRVAAVVAAAAAVVAVLLGVRVDHLNQQVNALRASTPLTRAEQAAMASPSTREVALKAPSAGAAPVGKVTVFLTRTGTGFVEAGGLSSLPDSETYQLWGVIGSRTISLGLLGSAPRVVPFSVAGNVPVDAFAITAEHAGGVVQSTRQPVVEGDVTA
ncbi:MAG: anti-sigma factor [Acidimicrobiales bacterium]